MGLGSSLKKTFGGIARQVPGVEDFYNTLGGPGDSAINAAIRQQRNEAGLPAPKQEELTAANIFKKLTPAQQKDLLINNPNIVTPGGKQFFDPATNTIRLEESPFQEEQRQRQESLAAELLGGLSGSLPNTIGDEVTQATFERAKNLLDPEFEQSRERLEQQLSDQGIPRGSEAYNEAINRLERSQGAQLQQLSLGSVLQGTQTAEAQRAARFNEIASLLGQQQVGGIGFNQFQPQSSGLDLFGAEQASLNRQFQGDQARKDRSAQQRAALIGALGSAGSSVIGAFASDKRLKQNIHKVGKSPSGLDIVEFNYIEDFADGRFRGVLAQDIEKIKPEAVINDPETGYKKVRYDLLDVDFERIA